MQETFRQLSDYGRQIENQKNIEDIQWIVKESIRKHFESDGKQFILQTVLNTITDKLQPVKALLAVISDPPEDFLSAKEACELLNISRGSLYNQKRNPHFPLARRIGRRIIYSRKEIIEYLNSTRQASQKPVNRE